MFFLFKQKTAYELRISDWSSDVCSSDLVTYAQNNRETIQGLIGLRGDITPAIGWDAYYQYGRSKESIVVKGDGTRSAFAGLVNTTDIFEIGRASCRERVCQYV